jgi:hypothetical protein
MAAVFACVRAGFTAAGPSGLELLTASCCIATAPPPAADDVGGDGNRSVAAAEPQPEHDVAAQLEAVPTTSAVLRQILIACHAAPGARYPAFLVSEALQTIGALGRHCRPTFLRLWMHPIDGGAAGGHETEPSEAAAAAAAVPTLDQSLEHCLRSWTADENVRMLAVSHFCACIGSPCLRRCGHGASIGQDPGGVHEAACDG